MLDPPRTTLTGKRQHATAWTLFLALLPALASTATAQDATPPAPMANPAPAVAPAPLGPEPTNAELAAEMRSLRAEVAEARALKAELLQLRGEIRALGELPAADVGIYGEAGNPRGGTTSEAGGGNNGVPERYHSGAFAGSDHPDPATSRFGLKARYKYNDKATGPLGGGGYFSVSSDDDEFSLNVTNQVTVDGTFVDRNKLPTNEQGFNIPFNRTFLYGNITKDWSYQVGVQGFLGTFNLLDAFLAWHLTDTITLRAGKGLAPPLYEYYAFSPALEPVITNSPLYQLAGKRPIGIMLTGTLLEKRIQWWSGVNNSGASLFGNIDRNQDFNGAFDVTPFRGEGWEGTIWEGLGGGVGFSAGKQQYLLDQGGTAFANNGESTTNSAFTTVLGIPFHSYNANVSADGMRSVFAPHVYWFGRFSALAEYIDHSRVLTDGETKGRSTQRGYYVNLSYYLTGESDFKGNGFQGYSTVIPNRPFIPSRRQYGPGAWQIASQWSELNAGTGDFARGFVTPGNNASRMGNFMAGVNWWPNQYTRLSLDYVWTHFNEAIPLGGQSPVDRYQTIWMRFAMFF
jgi:phosphate-selective porin OprO/OprP